MKIIIKIILFIIINAAVIYLLNISPKHFSKLKASKFKLKKNKEQKWERIVPRKLNYFEKRKVIAEEVLNKSNLKINYSTYIRFVMLCAIVGFLVGIVLNNIVLSIVLSIGFSYIPINYLRIKHNGYVKYINDQLETALSLITSTYIQVEDKDIVAAFESNIDRIEEPLKGIFKEFIVETKFIDASLKKAIYKMKFKIDNYYFQDWCDRLIQCVDDRDLKYVLPAIIDKMSDSKKLQAESDTIMYKNFTDFATVVALVVINIPALRFLNKQWFINLTTTFPGKLVMVITAIVILISTAYVIKVNKPIQIK